jgi:hypothetical protein
MDAQIGSFEYFCDAAYFDMWCVRRVGDRTFGQGFHVLNEQSAKALAEELSSMADPAAEIAALRKERDDLRAKLDEAVQEMCQIKPYLNWTVSDESPGYHPTMPSAVGRFNAALARIKGE